MYTAITSVQVLPDKLDEAARTYQAEVLPLTKQLAGLQNVKGLIDRKTNTLTMLLTYDTEANADAVPSGEVWRQSINAMQQFFASPPTRQVYEVVMEA